MTKKIVVLGALVLALGAIAGAIALTQAGASPQTSLTFQMRPYQEVPSVSNPGGFGSIELDRLGPQTLGYRLRWTGLTGPPMFAHIHFGQRGVNGGVSAFLCGGSTKGACPQSTTGTVEGTVVPADVIGPSGQGISAGEFGELIDAMMAGVTYANIHTQVNPGGELRGQIDLN